LTLIGCVVSVQVTTGSAHQRWSASPTSTYWDYVRLRFPRREGMRIDFVLGSPALAARTKGALIDREERKGKGASDHAPVIVELAD
jgi:exodeoxyribonuclease-3